MTELVGHEAVRERFHQQQVSRRMHHAWLLHGPEGIGKRMLAHELATAYLCRGNIKRREGGESAEQKACGECHDCRMMAAGSHPDFLLLEREWDDKKKRLKRDVHIGQVRDLLGFLSLSGAESARRVALIADAGRMNAQAANALLKGLEEPSAGSLLFVVCADALLLPATVRSRCLMQYLTPLGEDAVRTILTDMQVPGRVMDLAVGLASGQPGRVAALTEVDVADALLAWQELLACPESFDIGQVQQWITRHVGKVPHALIVDVVTDVLRTRLLQSPEVLPPAKGAATEVNVGMTYIDAVLDVCRDLSAWPAEVVRRTLRPAPTLLAHMLSLRIALRDLKKAA